MAGFVPGDTVEYIPSMQEQGSNNRYIGEIERCWGPDVHSSFFRSPNTCEFRVTKAQINPRSLMYPYKPGERIAVHIDRLRRISTSPSSLNRTRKRHMLQELTALPNVPRLFPGGTNYLHARNRIRRNRLRNLVKTLPGPPPGGSLFEGGRRKRRTRRRRSRRV